MTLSSLVHHLQGPVCVIGATGFIGANLLRACLQDRDDVFGTVFSGNHWRLSDMPTSSLVFMNTGDISSVERVFTRLRPRTVFDCSAFGAYSFEKNANRIHATNYLDLIGLLEYFCEHQLYAYVHAGTSSEYGLNAAAPEESDVLEPNSHYALSKAAASLAIRYYGMQRGLPAINLRLYSAYGPYEDASRLIPVLCRTSLEGRLPPFARPRTSRDFIHVDDVTRAFLLAAVRMDHAFFGESFNIGTGVKTSLADLAILAKRVFGISEDPVFSRAEARAWDVDDWYANPEKAQKTLGFCAAIRLEDGLVQTRDWWRQAEDRFDPAAWTKKGTSPRKKFSVSAIVACYNDIQAIPVMHQRLTKTFNRLGLEYEIIFVNDGSPDDSAEVIRRISASDPHVTGITHSRNFGSQAAFRSGMEIACKEAVVLLDGDLQDPPEVIEGFVREWRNGADVVYGRRVKRDMKRGMEFFYKSFYRLMSRLSEFPIPRDAGDFSLIDRKVVYWLLKCEERDSFLRGLRAYVGFTQVGVDYVRPERMFGKSTNNWLKNIGWAKKGIFSFTRVPLHALTAVGAGALAVSLCVALYVIVMRFLAPDQAPRGITFLSLLIMFFGSFTIFGIGMLGEYLGKIFEEAKARPAFIRKELIAGGEMRPMNGERQ